jgi:hypothetical protein
MAFAPAGVSKPAVTISGANVAMGPLERIVVADLRTSSSSLPVRGGGISIIATNRATLGDITALGDISVSALQVMFNVRDPAPQFNQQLLASRLTGGQIEVDNSQDGILSFVSGSTIQFTGPGSTGAPQFLNGTRATVGFATFDGNPGGGVNVPGGVVSWNQQKNPPTIPLGAANSALAVADPMVIGNGGPVATVFFPLLSTGPSLVNPSNAIASVLPSEAPTPAAAAELSAGDVAGLHEIGIDVRGLDAAEFEAQMRKNAVFDDVPGERAGSLVPTAGLDSLQVAIGRLPVGATKGLLETFHEIFYDPEVDPKTGQPLLDTDGQPKWAVSSAKGTALATKIEAGWKAFQAYRETAKDVPATGTEFRNYLEGHVANKALKDNGEADALAQLKLLQGLYARADAINLAPTELRKVRSAIFRMVKAAKVESSRGDPLNDQTVLESAAGAQPISLAARK